MPEHPTSESEAPQACPDCLHDACHEALDRRDRRRGWTLDADGNQVPPPWIADRQRRHDELRDLIREEGERTRREIARATVAILTAVALIALATAAWVDRTGTNTPTATGVTLADYA